MVGRQAWAATSKTSLTKQQNQGSVTGTAVTLKAEMLERGIRVARRAGRAQPKVVVHSFPNA